MTAPIRTRQCHLSNACLTDLPEDILISILKQQPLKTKCHAQAVCKMFRDILCKPSQGLLVWGAIHLNDPIFAAVSPTALARWLNQRVCGASSLHYAPGANSKSSTAEPAAVPTLRREYQIYTEVLPKVAAMLSQAAEIQLNLGSAFVEPFLGSDEPTLHKMRYACFVQPPWATLARCLSSLQLRHSHGIGRAMTSVLHQTTRLQRLSLHGAKTSRFPKANLELALPELKRLSLQGFSNVQISLNCPRLEELCLQFLRPLESLQGLPQTLNWISLKHLGKGSLPLEKIFQEQRLEQVRLLQLRLRPETYEDPCALEVIERVLRNGRLQTLSTDCPPVKLVLIEGLQCLLPFSLRKLELHICLKGGIPVVLEQLQKLQKLQFVDTGEGHLHLDRPLDPFLDMADLVLLTFSGKHSRAGQVAKPLCSTPDAHKFLGLARQRIAEGDIKPHGRTVLLKVQDHDQPDTV